MTKLSLWDTSKHELLRRNKTPQSRGKKQKFLQVNFIIIWEVSGKNSSSVYIELQVKNKKLSVKSWNLGYDCNNYPKKALGILHSSWKPQVLLFECRIMQPLWKHLVCFWEWKHILAIWPRNSASTQQFKINVSGPFKGTVQRMLQTAFLILVKS